jgi:serine/threonine protein kinase
MATGFRLALRHNFFGKYEIVECVGRGGQGDLWKVWDVEFRRIIAMKRLSIEALKSPPAVYRFLAEAQIISQLEHPGILPVFDVGLDPDGRPYYTTQLLPGTTFADVWREVRTDPERGQAIIRAQELLARVCDIMAHAHSRGVIHRDLKPVNVLVGNFGDVRVIDWGSAHVLENSRSKFEETFVTLNRLPIQTDRGEACEADPSHATGSSGLPVTTLFTAPELLAGELGQIGPETDIYSVGVMLYELLTGCPPYSRDDGSLPPDLKNVILTGPPRAVRKMKRTVSRDFAAICDKAMAYKKADRYRTMELLANDIRAALTVRPVMARNPGILLTLQKWALRNSGYVLIGSASLALICVVLLISHGLRVERDVARQVKALRSGELAARSGRWKDALRNWDEAEASGYADSVYLGLQRAEVWTVLNEPEKSGALLRELAGRSRLGTKRALVLLRLGEHELFDKTTFDQGVQHVRAALAAGLEGADRSFANGLLADSTRDALKCFREALRLNPYHYGAHLHALSLEFLLGLHPDLEEHVRVFKVLFPEDPSPTFIQATDFAARGRLADAEKCLAPLQSSLDSDLWRNLDSGLRLLAEAAEYYDVDTLLGEHQFDKTRLDQLMARAGAIVLAANPSDFATPSTRYRMPELPCVHTGLQEGVEALQTLTLPFFKDLRPSLEKLNASWGHHPEALIPFRAGNLLEARQPRNGPRSPALLAVQADLYQMAADSPSVMPGIERSARFLATKAQFELASSVQTNSGAFRAACVNNIRAVAFSDETSAAECQAYFNFARTLGELELARALLDKLEIQRPGDALAVHDRIQMDTAAGCLGPALNLVENILAKNPEDAWAREQRQAILQQIEELVRSVPDLK